MSEARSHYGMQLAKLQDRLTELQQGVKAEHEKSATLQSQVRALTDEVKTARAAKEVAQQQLSQSKNDNVLVSPIVGRLGMRWNNRCPPMQSSLDSNRGCEWCDVR